MVIVLAAILLSIPFGEYDEAFLNVLNVVGTIWGGLTGAVIGFYFGGAQADATEEGAEEE